MDQKEIKLEQGCISYWTNETVNNQKPAIIFCHGLTADNHLFDLQIPEFKECYRIINWDIPLHGHSRPWKNFCYKSTAKALKSILTKENIEKIILVGQSAGGYISQAFIYYYPEMVSGFVGIGTTPFDKQYYKASELFWIKHYVPIARMIPYGYYCRIGSKAVTVTEKARESMHQTLVKLGKQGMLEAAGAIYGELIKWEKPVHFNMPVMLSYGESDKTGKVIEYNKKWAKKNGFDIISIPKAAHNANYDNPEFFNSLLHDFMNKLN